jgi:hypothetical protein
MTILGLNFPLRAQIVSTQFRPHTIIEERKIELNDGLRSQVGVKSKTMIKIDLLLNTKNGITVSPLYLGQVVQLIDNIYIQIRD